MDALLVIITLGFRGGAGAPCRRTPMVVSGGNRRGAMGGAEGW